VPLFVIPPGSSIRAGTRGPSAAGWIFRTLCVYEGPYALVDPYSAWREEILSLEAALRS
jgi:hypothetical protein